MCKGGGSCSSQARYHLHQEDRLVNMDEFDSEDLSQYLDTLYITEHDSPRLQPCNEPIYNTHSETTASPDLPQRRQELEDDRPLPQRQLRGKTDKTNPSSFPSSSTAQQRVKTEDRTRWKGSIDGSPGDKQGSSSQVNSKKQHWLPGCTTTPLKTPGRGRLKTINDSSSGNNKGSWLHSNSARQEQSLSGNTSTELDTRDRTRRQGSIDSTSSRNKERGSYQLRCVAEGSSTKHPTRLPRTQDKQSGDGSSFDKPRISSELHRTGYHPSSRTMHPRKSEIDGNWRRREDDPCSNDTTKSSGVSGSALRSQCKTAAQQQRKTDKQRWKRSDDRCPSSEHPAIPGPSSDTIDHWKALDEQWQGTISGWWSHTERGSSQVSCATPKSWSKFDLTRYKLMPPGFIGPYPRCIVETKGIKKSTLNPNASPFVMNPNAKVFVPGAQ